MGFQGRKRVATGSENPGKFCNSWLFFAGFTFFQFSIFFIWRIVSILAELSHILSIAAGVF